MNAIFPDYLHLQHSEVEFCRVFINPGYSNLQPCEVVKKCSAIPCPLCFYPYPYDFFQASELFFFGCLMVADMALLGFLSRRFTYVKIEDTLEGDTDENSEASGNNNANNIPLEEKKQSKDD